MCQLCLGMEVHEGISDDILEYLQVNKKRQLAQQ